MLSINSIYLVFFTTGITIGLGHCIGMCGPIVISLSLQLKERPYFWPHLLYNLGRTSTYGLLGGIAGATASFTRLADGIGGLQRGVMILAGVIIILMGLAMSGLAPASTIFGNFPAVNTFISKRFKGFRQGNKPTLIYYPLGLLLGLLPCGPVYTALIAAARAGMEAATTLGAMVTGAMIMVSFGLGTIFALMLVARLSDLTWLKHRQIIYQVGAMLMIVMGVYFIWKAIKF